jgi:6-phosphofructokinase 2
MTVAPAQAPLLTVTLNPAVDLSASVPRVVAGPKLRLSDPVAEPGGGGVNVARAVVRLGGACTAVVALGGAMGQRHAALMGAERLVPLAFDAPGETRHSLAVTDATGAQYRFVLPGAPWPAATARAALAAILDACPPGAIVVLSGSQPPGVDPGFPADLAAALAGRGARLVVDTSGPALDRLVQAPRADGTPAVLRMDAAEAAAAAGRGLATRDDTARFAAALVARGVAETVVMARGAEGSVLARAGVVLHCRPPAVAVASAVGAGDAFTGAFALALARGAGWDGALRDGTAAAAATVATPGTALFDAAGFAAALPGCVLVAL